MSVFETIDLRKLNKVTELSRTEKSQVSLVSLEDGKEFAILKEYKNRNLLPLTVTPIWANSWRIYIKWEEDTSCLLR